MAKVIAFVKLNPGLRCEEIAEALSIKPSILSVMLREARAAGKLRSRGNTRGTSWRAVVSKEATKHV